MTKLIEEACDKTIEEIFGSALFFIPKFQRNFVWNWDKTKKMLNDILSNNEYFIGNIVVYNEELKSRKGIVDGQQRLTVLTIILCVLREIQKKYSCETGINRFIKREDTYSGKDIPVLDIDSSYPFFRAKIQKMEAGNISSNSNDNIVEKNNFEKIEKIYEKTLNFFDEIIKSTENKKEKINEIFTKILHTKVIFISTSNMMDSNLIFEILNTGNTPLSELDLFKNLTYKNLKHLSNEHDEISEVWKNIEKEANSANINLNDYLYNETQLFFKKDLSTKKGFFKDLNNKIHDGDVEEITTKFFSDFRDNIRHFIKITNPLYSFNEQNIINKNNNFNNKKDIKNLKLNLYDLVESLEIKQHISPVYMAYIMYLNDKLSLQNFTNYIKYLENAHFVFSNLLSTKSSLLSNEHNKLKKEIIEHQDNKDYINNIVSNFKFSKVQRPDLETFKNKFKEKIFYNKTRANNKKLRFVLKKIHCYANSSETFDCIDFNVEHLVVNSNIDDNFINSIGNLLLVPKKLNSEELENKTLIEKLKILKKEFVYKICCLDIDSIINNLENKLLTEEDFIKNRTEELINTLYGKILII